jgi:hypothetical protein
MGWQRHASAMRCVGNAGRGSSRADSYHCVPAGRSAGGRSLLAEAAITTLLLGGSTAAWQLAIPNDPMYLGLSFYNQGFALDPPANPLGLTVSNGARAVIGI